MNSQKKIPYKFTKPRMASPALEAHWAAKSTEMLAAAQNPSTANQILVTVAVKPFLWSIKTSGMIYSLTQLHHNWMVPLRWLRPL